MSLLTKIRWNLAWHFQRARLRLLGRDLTCHRCGRVIARAIVSVSGGQVWLDGLALSEVFVDFADRDRLRFRHLDRSECNPPAEL